MRKNARVLVVDDEPGMLEVCSDSLERLRDATVVLEEAYRLVGTPCLLTSLTTALGFSAMSFVPIRSLAESENLRLSYLGKKDAVAGLRARKQWLSYWSPHQRAAY